MNKKQEKTLESIKQIDKKGLLYKIDYYADYKIDEILSHSKTGYDIDECVSKVLLNNEYKLEFTLNQLGCTCFTTKNDLGNIILGRNYDFSNENHLCGICETKSGEYYKYVGALDLYYLGLRQNNLNDINHRASFLYSPLQVQDGINEKGFACSILLLNEGKTIQKRNKTPLISTLVVSLLLSKASSVKEACEILDNYDIVAFFKDNNNHHWIMCDQSNMAIVEYVDNKMKIIKSEDFLTATNFYLSLPKKGQNGLGFSRHAIISNLLELNPNPSNEIGLKYLEQVKYSLQQDLIDNVPFEREIKLDAITYWSEIFDTKEKSMSFIFKEDYNKIYKFKL